MGETTPTSSVRSLWLLDQEFDDLNDSLILENHDNDLKVKGFPGVGPFNLSLKQRRYVTGKVVSDARVMECRHWSVINHLAHF